MSPAITDSRYLVTAGWDDVPHLTEQAKRELLESTPRYLRDARSKGTPSLGAGAIYPFGLDEILVRPFPIPAFWKRAYGLDVGWRKTAAIWGAHDPAADIWYLYTEHYMGEERPVIHAEAIKARGVTTLVECGPGKVLAGMTKRIDAELNGVALYDPATLSEIKGLLA